MGGSICVPCGRRQHCGGPADVTSWRGLRGTCLKPSKCGDGHLGSQKQEAEL